MKLQENLYVNINVNRYSGFVKTRNKLHLDRFGLFERVIRVSPKGKNLIVKTISNTLLTLPQQVSSFRRIALCGQETLRARPEFKVPGCLHLC